MGTTTLVIVLLNIVSNLTQAECVRNICNWFLHAKLLFKVPAFEPLLEKIE